MKIIFVISSLDRGGAEKVLAYVANHFAEHDHRVSVLTWDHGDRAPAYALNPLISHTPLGLQNKSANQWIALVHNVKRIRAMRRVMKLQAPDAVISFMGTINVITLISLAGLDIPVMVSERTDPRAQPVECVWRFLRWVCYPFAQGIIVQTEEAKAYFPKWLRQRIYCIPNPVPKANAAQSSMPARPMLLAIGRLVSLKRFDLLIRAFASLKGKYPEWKLIILGDGTLKSALEDLRDSSDMRLNIEFPGIVSDVEPYIRNASVFVLPSDFEGFPNALCEAMAHGLPVIATATAGSKAIIRNGIDGVLIPIGDLKQLTTALDELLGDTQRRERLGKKAKEIGDRFSAKRVLGLWDDMLSHIKVTSKT